MESASSTPLSQLDVLVLDCQATAAAPRGHLLEIGWARAAIADTRACLIALPDGTSVPPSVARLTGITDRMVTRAGIDAGVAWRALRATAATLPAQPAPTVIHFARFEQPFLHQMAGGPPPFDIVCTHAIAQRLLPDLPRRSLRALAGYFGRAVGPLRRSADHIDATMFVWQELVRMLDAQGVSTWRALNAWLAATPVPSAAGRSRRVWPMPRDVRLAVPDAPGVYRMLRGSGDVLYVGKAASLHHRVNSYFRHQRGVAERLLEMLTQARAVSFEVCPSALEAALLEADEIKRLRPPYNIALVEGERDVWFATPDLGEWRTRPSNGCLAGPFPSAEPLEQFAALVGGRREALGRGRWAPDERTFGDGYARLCATHPELSLRGLSGPARLLRLGTRLWREGRRGRDDEAEGEAGELELVPESDRGRAGAAWTPDSVRIALEWIAVQAALARRRAVWFTRLMNASVSWREPDGIDARLLVIDNGDIAGVRSGNLTFFTCDPAPQVEEPAVPHVKKPRVADLTPPIVKKPRSPDLTPVPVPPGHHRPIAERHEAVTLARFDRLRVLTTELKRLVAARAPVAVRFGVQPPLAGDRLAALLWWL